MRQFGTPSLFDGQIPVFPVKNPVRQSLSGLLGALGPTSSGGILDLVAFSLLACNRGLTTWAFFYQLWGSEKWPGNITCLGSEVWELQFEIFWDAAGASILQPFAQFIRLGCVCLGQFQLAQVFLAFGSPMVQTHSCLTFLLLTFSDHLNHVSHLSQKRHEIAQKIPRNPLDRMFIPKTIKHIRQIQEPSREASSPTIKQKLRHQSNKKCVTNHQTNTLSPTITQKLPHQPSNKNFVTNHQTKSSSPTIKQKHHHQPSNKNIINNKNQ